MSQSNTDMDYSVMISKNQSQMNKTHKNNSYQFVDKDPQTNYEQLRQHLYNEMKLQIESPELDLEYLMSFPGFTLRYYPVPTENGD